MILLVLSPVLTGIMMAVVPVVVFGAVGYGKFLQKVSKKYQKSLSKGGEVRQFSKGGEVWQFSKAR